MKHLKIIAQKPGIPGFAMVFQNGVKVQAPVGISLHDFLVRNIGLDKAYVAERITTVFLDGRPVDKLEDTRLADGSTIALSGAMPGLAGAILRRDTPLVSMRSKTFTERTPVSEQSVTITFQVRLFNVLIGELGPIFLARGIMLEPGELRSIIDCAKFGEDTVFILDDEPVSRAGLFSAIETGGETHIIVSVVTPKARGSWPPEIRG